VEAKLTPISMPEPRYRHYRNPNGEARTCFTTSTCLDFAHLFARPELKSEMTKSLLSDCHYYNARLHAFVVMSHHIHLLVTPSESSTISQLIQKVKRNSAKLISPMLNADESKQLQAQSGLNQRSFWMRSFRAVTVETEEIFFQKVNYIHQNPVRANLVEEPADYSWSSARLYQAELQDGFFGLDMLRALDLFRP
jgi:putative transposase